MKAIFTFTLCLLTLAIGAQEISVKGNVTDDTGLPLAGVNIMIKNTTIGTQTDFDGNYSLKARVGQKLVFSYIGYKTIEKKVSAKTSVLNVRMETANDVLDEVVVLGKDKSPKKAIAYDIAPAAELKAASGDYFFDNRYGNTVSNNESYARIDENSFKKVRTAPLSTFSIDVDKAGYSNIRRIINNGQKVPVDAVKIEEMINYFDYKYPNPKGDEAFSITADVANTPWNRETKLVRIGLKGKDINASGLPASNLVFLIDVSGSMNSENKLGLLKSAFGVLVDQLREQDKVSIVVYAGAAGLVLEPTSGIEKATIMKAVTNLRAGGSTAGGQGLELAYKIAGQQFIKGGNNRIVLATDGDFNVGASSDRAMEDLIIEKRKSGIFLTVLGFGIGNYKDSKMETLADKGNGNHAYIDSMQEARKVLGVEFFGTIYTIAKDVKIQVEFNPAKVQAYRLIGYENRLLNDEDFNDDTKDAGELGSGHTVTALYEIIPVGVKSDYVKDIDPLKYSEITTSNSSSELLTVKFRYKEPAGNTSKLIARTLNDSNKTMKEMPADFKFAVAVALFAQQLRKSEFIKNTKRQDVIDLAEAGREADQQGYRAEFIRLVKSY